MLREGVGRRAATRRSSATAPIVIDAAGLLGCVQPDANCHSQSGRDGVEHLSGACYGGDDPGPAGRLLVAWRRLDRSAPLAAPLAGDAVLHVAETLSLRVDDALRGDRRSPTARRLGRGRSVRGRPGASQPSAGEQQ